MPKPRSDKKGAGKVTGTPKKGKFFGMKVPFLFFQKGQLRQNLELLGLLCSVFAII